MTVRKGRLLDRARVTDGATVVLCLLTGGDSGPGGRDWLEPSAVAPFLPLPDGCPDFSDPGGDPPVELLAPSASALTDAIQKMLTWAKKWARCSVTEGGETDSVRCLIFRAARAPPDTSAASFAWRAARALQGLAAGSAASAESKRVAATELQ